MTTRQKDQIAQASTSLRTWVRMVATYLLMPVVLFACAGVLSWWQGWVYSLLVVTSGIGGRILAERRSPGLMEQRQNLDNFQDAKPWDKVLSPLMAVSASFPIIIVAGLDHRFGGRAPLPLWVNWLGLLTVAVGYGFAVWALVENRFFSSVVRIQTERAHTVCDTGPYRIVRHPAYAGNVLALPGIVLALNSLWVLIPVAFALIIAVTRTSLEDRTLQAELPGYQAYARRVRFRLFPGIW